jgi:hypothetical protein
MIDWIDMMERQPEPGVRVRVLITETQGDRRVAPSEPEVSGAWNGMGWELESGEPIGAVEWRAVTHWAPLALGASRIQHCLGSKQPLFRLNLLPEGGGWSVTRFRSGSWGCWSTAPRDPVRA